MKINTENGSRVSKYMETITEISFITFSLIDCEKMYFFINMDEARISMLNTQALNIEKLN